MSRPLKAGLRDKSRYDWSEVVTDENKPLAGLEWAAVIATMLAAFFAGATVYLMVRMYEATGRYF